MGLHEHLGMHQLHVLCHADNPSLDPTVQTGQRSPGGDLQVTGRRQEQYVLVALTDGPRILLYSSKTVKQ